ncbi:hypothetical protein Plo01_68710 [Planobispora longispora]|uniref:Uncharacterized protein n=1 Tax=Planobispora longispora TaxID=28887 RepID=A0A8J3RV30_9ACTN|nr:hypothetical protein Plo01_68710 [Planobispora longispora]
MRGRLLRPEVELPLDHAEHVDGDPGVEADPALDGGKHIALQEVADRGDEPRRRRDVMRAGRQWVRRRGRRRRAGWRGRRRALRHK